MTVINSKNSNLCQIRKIDFFVFISLFIIITAINIQAKDEQEYRINKINFSGNEHYSDKELLSLMNTKQSSLFRSTGFDKKILKNDLKKIRLFYQNKGYLKADVENYKITVDSAKAKINISIKINEGPLYKIKSITFTGNTFLDSTYLLNHLSISNNTAFNVLSLERAKIEIINLYKKKGFLDALSQFSYTASKKEEEFIVNFQIKEGIRYKIGSIHIEGLEKTKENIVRREFRFKSGEYYLPLKLLETQNYLYRTGLFYSINIRHIPAADGDSTKRDIIIKLKESEPGVFDISLGYGSVEKIRLTSSISYMNFFGRAYRSRLLGRISSLEKRIETTFTDPWLLGIPIEGSAGFELSQENQPSYDLFYYNLKANLMKEFSLNFKSSLMYEYGTGKYTDIKLDFYNNIGRDSLGLADSLLIIILNNLDYNIDRQSLKLSLYRDYRDNIFNPWKGHYIDASIQYIYGNANLLFFESYKTKLINKILKFSSNYRYYYAFNNTSLLATSFDFGIMDFFDSSDINFLLSDLFYAGGPNSLRGFAYRAIGPKDEQGVGTGGRFKVVWNALEYRQKILKFLYTAFFVDVGNVWSNYQDFRWDEIRIDYGLGIRLDSPIGIIRFDFALNPFPQGNEAKYQFWFGIGQAF